VLLAVAAAGCGNTVKTVPGGTENRQPLEVKQPDTYNPATVVLSGQAGLQQDPVGSDAPAFPQEPVIIIGESEDKPGWKVFNSSGHYVFVTDDWSEFTVSEEAETAPFSFHFPGDFNFDGASIFYDQNDYKKAEILSGLIYLKPGQKIWDKVRAESYLELSYRTTIISEESVSFNGLEGVRIVEKGRFYSHNGDGRAKDWFIHRYILSDGSYAFYISFWEADKLRPESKSLFNEIMSTFRIVQTKQRKLI